jgi:predicted RNase H-like HicB family nuclease
MSIVELENEALTFSRDWREGKAYRCHICLIPEEDGSFSAIVLNLSGAGSCGDTEEEALKNVREAVLGVIESYTDAGDEIPWEDSRSEDIPPGAKQIWILVNAE